MEIRRINSNETDLVAGLFDQYRVFYKQAPDLNLAERFITERLSNNESVIFVALHKKDDKTIPVGFTQLYPAYSSVRALKNWILNDLYVSADWRKQGIGEKLLRAAMQFAKETNAKYVQLETAADNYAAQSLYVQTGFVRQPQETEYYTYRISIE